MALRETFAYRVEVNENKCLNVRKADIVLKDDVEIARSYHRTTFAPGDDVSNQPQEVQNIAAVVWNEKVIADYQANLS